MIRDPLKFRLERLQQRASLRLQLLQLFYDRHSIAERYVEGQLEIHAHLARFGEASQGLCLVIRAADSDRGCAAQPGDSNEDIVLVEVGKLSDPTEPVRSVVGLQEVEA